MTFDYHIFKSWLNNFFGRYIGRDKRPTFFDINQTYPSLNLITDNFAVIKDELNTVLTQTRRLPTYHEIDPGEAAISNTTEKKWNVFLLHLLSKTPHSASALCPNTCRLITKIPNLIQAVFSIMEPGKNVPLHEGPYFGYLRYHLGLQIPKHNPPTIIVNKQSYTWQEGEAVLFDDSWPHEVKNNSDDYRAVLIIDVLRPMPSLPTLINKFAASFIAKHTYGRKVIKRANQYQVLQ